MRDLLGGDVLIAAVTLNGAAQQASERPRGFLASAVLRARVERRLRDLGA